MSRARPRRATRAGRIADYLAVTFPPVTMLVAAAISFAAVYFLLEALALHARLAYTWRALGATVTCYGMSLLLRIYDELKDADVDRRLAAAGDPKYLERPIPRGMIDEADLQALRWMVSGIVLGVSATLGPVLFAGFVVLYATFWMSFRWYFWPKMREHLLIAFATHNPLTLLLQSFAALAYVEDFGWGDLGVWPLVATLVGQQGLASAWEVARKIRAPDEETDYVTYSRALGWRVAPLLPLGAVLLSTGCVLWVSERAGLSEIYLAAVAAAAVLPIAALVRFRLAPSAKSAKLRPYVEAFAAVVNVGGLVALVARWGMAYAPMR